MPLGYYAKQFKRNLEKNADTSTQPSVIEIGAFRASVSDYFKSLLREVNLPSNIDVETITLQLYQHEVKATIYKLSDAKALMPVIVFHPGGGLALDMAEYHAHACAAMVIASRAAVVCIQPHLSPENKFPEIFDAAYKATCHFYQEAEKYGFDSQQLIISGYSMGGTIAALITSKATKNKDELNIVGQVIISGVLHIDNLPSESGEDFMFNPDIHVKFVEMSLPSDITIEAIKNNPLFSPIYADLSDFPPTCLIAGECDAFKPDTLEMAKHLKSAGRDVHVIIIPGQIHNTLLLYPIMGDNEDPAVEAGKQAAHLFCK